MIQLCEPCGGITAQLRPKGAYTNGAADDRFTIATAFVHHRVVLLTCLYGTAGGAFLNRLIQALSGNGGAPGFLTQCSRSCLAGKTAAAFAGGIVSLAHSFCGRGSRLCAERGIGTRRVRPPGVCRRSIRTPGKLPDSWGTDRTPIRRRLSHFRRDSAPAGGTAL